MLRSSLRIRTLAHFLPLFAFFCIPHSLLQAQDSDPIPAQSITGVVYDHVTGEGLPYVNIRIPALKTGAFTDEEGNFEIPFDGDTLTLIFDYLGYAQVDTLLQPGRINIIHLAEKDVQIEGVTILPDYSWDRYLFRKIIAHKSENDPERNPGMDYVDYARTFVYLDNLNASIKERKVFRDAESAFMHTSDTTVMMPILMVEEVTRCSENAITTLAHKSEGILDQVNDQLQSVVTNKLAHRINFYRNHVAIGGRGFPSPLSGSALRYYNIYVTDSTLVGQTKHYQFDFYPKSEKNNTFRGQFWVEDSSFALTRVTSKLPAAANVNFIQGFEVDLRYRKTAAAQWIYDQQRIQLAMVFRKQDSVDAGKSRYVIRKTIDFQAPDRVPLAGDSGSRPAAMAAGGVDLIETLRSRPLDALEARAWQGIQVLQDNGLVRQVDKLVAMGMTGYYNLGPFDLGPFYDFYRRNQIEGHRGTFAFRTSRQLSPHFSVGGYLGYGFGNRQFKYGGNLHLRLPGHNGPTLTARYYDDYFSLSQNKYIEFVRENPFSQGDGNIISSFTTVPNPFIIQREHLSISLKHQSKKDIGFLVRPFYNRVTGTSLVRLARSVEAEPAARPGRFQNYGVLLDTRLSFGQDFDNGFFTRYYYGNSKPVIHLTTEVGYNEVQQQRNPYAHFQVSLKNKFNLGQGHLRMLVDAGHILGTVPFPMLHMPRGSQSLGYARYNYNLLRHASFASDLYTNAYLSLNGGGVLFNKLPLIRKLNLRESVSFKSFYGRYTRPHETVFALPQGIYKAADQPYAELGVGVSNIFKFLRVEYVRRLSNGALMDQVASRWGIRLRLEVGF